MIAPDEAGAVRPGEELNLQRLNDYLTLKAPSVGPILEHRQFPGGYSNLTYLLRTASNEFILRRPPPGAAIKTAHDMSREFKVLSLLQKHYPKVPSPLILYEDPDVLGSPFYIMERLKGVILRPSNAKHIQLLPEDMRKVSEALVDNLSVLHSIDIYETGLIQLGKPEGYIQRQVEGWTRRYQSSETDRIVDMEELGKWLLQNQPHDAAPTLLHNDYKYDNLVLREDNLAEIAGVLDWEMATVGDPGMDLGAALAYWAEQDDGDLAKVFNISWMKGNLTRKEVVQRYSEKSRRTIMNPVFYYAFGLYKNAVIAQQIYARWKQGHSKDPRFGTLIHVIHNLAQRGVKAAATNSL